MTNFAKFASISPDKVGQPLFEALCTICPEGRYWNRFFVRLPAEDPRVASLQACLAQAGLTPRRSFAKPLPNQYSLEMEREYDRTDWDVAEYLVPRARIDVLGLGRTGDGKPKLSRSPIPCTAVVVGGADPEVTVIDWLKDAILQARMRHAQFEEVQMCEGASWPGESWWALTSDLTLPALSSHCDLRDEDGQPCDGRRGNGCFLKEGLLRRGELRYTRAAIASVGDFDIALTREWFGGRTGPCHPRLVASSRFYQFCRKQKLKMDWIPVRVDPE